jgi:hypothetical protein
LNVALFGTEFVGSTTGCAWRMWATTWTCLDVDSEQVDRLQHRIPPSHGAGLAELMQAVAERVVYSTDAATAISAEVNFIAVGTPPQARWHARSAVSASRRRADRPTRSIQFASWWASTTHRYCACGVALPAAGRAELNAPRSLHSRPEPEVKRRRDRSRLPEMSQAGSGPASVPNSLLGQETHVLNRRRWIVRRPFMLVEGFR